MNLFTTFCPGLHKKLKNIDDDSFFKYVRTVPLKRKNIGKHPETIAKKKPFIGKYDWQEINFPSEAKDWKNFEMSTKLIAVDDLFPPQYRKNKTIAISKHKLERPKQLIL